MTPENLKLVRSDTSEDIREKLPTIVNYATKEEDIKTRFFFYRGYLLNISENDISFGRDKKGNEYLKVTSIKS